MNKCKLTSGLVAGLLWMAGAAVYAGDAAVRVRCEADAVGGKVYINGMFMGICSENSLDSYVPAGNVRIRVIKEIDATVEGLYEKEIYLGEGVAERVWVGTLIRQLNSEGLRQQMEAEVERKRQEAEKLAREIESERFRAERGDIEAMRSLMKRYMTPGSGVDQDDEQVRYWNERIAAATLEKAKMGDLSAMEEMTRRYATGDGIAKDASQEKYWDEQVAAIKAEIEAGRRKRARLADFNYTYVTDTVMDVVGEWDGTGYGSDGDFFLWSTCLPVRMISPVYWLTDLALTPSKYSSKILIEHDLALRPSKWAKPESMIAKAAAQESEVLLARR